MERSGRTWWHVRTRELARDEWCRFFNGFSRQYAGKPVTVDVIEESGSGRSRHRIVKRLPLLGITAEPASADVESIDIITGEPPDELVTHVVHNPIRVTVGQVSDGADEVMLIDSAGDPSVRVAFGAAQTDVADLLDKATQAERPGRSER